MVTLISMLSQSYVFAQRLSLGVQNRHKMEQLRGGLFNQVEHQPLEVFGAEEGEEQPAGLISGASQRNRSQ
jgi:hypothetical protein